jgi:hypothetical protein
VIQVIALRKEISFSIEDGSKLDEPDLVGTEQIAIINISVACIILLLFFSFCYLQKDRFFTSQISGGLQLI